MSIKNSLGGIDVLRLPVMLTDREGVVLYKNLSYSKCIIKPMTGRKIQKMLASYDREKFENAAKNGESLFISMISESVYHRAVVFPYGPDNEAFDSNAVMLWAFVPFFQLSSLNPIADETFSNPGKLSLELLQFFHGIENKKREDFCVKNVEYSLAEKTDETISSLIAKLTNALPDMSCDVKKVIASVCAFSHERFTKLGHRIVFSYDDIPDGCFCRYFIPVVRTVMQLVFCVLSLASDNRTAVNFSCGPDERLTVTIGFSSENPGGARTITGDSFLSIAPLIPLEEINLIFLQKIAEKRGWKVSCIVSSEQPLPETMPFGSNLRLGINSRIRVSTEPLGGVSTLSAVGCDMTPYVEEYIALMAKILWEDAQ